jgi:predicted acetyltransferase
MQNVALIKPSIDLQDQYLSFYQEWNASGEEKVPWVISKDPIDFQGMIKSLEDNERGVNLPEGWVSDSTYWLVLDESKVVGVVNIRHKLTTFLLNCGGHIGYGIRPSERQKGYATKLLKLSLEKAKELGINKVLIVCDANNIASEKTILNNNGIRDEDYIKEDGVVIKRYWIDN